MSPPPPPPTTTADDVVAQKLASRAYHLPGYGPWRDYLQYLFNNHPVLGVCFHNRLHPLGARRRALILLGSFSFGIAVTNGIYLWYVATGRDPGEEILSVSSGGGGGGGGVSLTHGALTLVTVGSLSHAVFDRFVWVLAVCCARHRHERRNRPGGGGGRRGRRSCPDVGGHLAVLVVVASVAAATCVAMVRASVDGGGAPVPFANGANPTGAEVAQTLDVSDNFNLDDWSFLRGYAIEFAVSLFAYYPLIETLLFSGVLGCGGLIPMLGGRPGEVRREMMESQVARRTDTTAMARQHHGPAPPPSTTSSMSTIPKTNAAAAYSGGGAAFPEKLFHSLPPPRPAAPAFQSLPPRPAAPARTTADAFVVGASSRLRLSLPSSGSPPPPLPPPAARTNINFGNPPPPPASASSHHRTANYFGTINATRPDDVSTIGDPDMGDGVFYPVPFADVTVGESVMSAGERRYAYGVSSSGMRGGGGPGGGVASGSNNLESVAEPSTVAGGFGAVGGSIVDAGGGGTTFGDDATLEAAYRDVDDDVGGGLGVVGGGDYSCARDDAFRRLVAIVPPGKVGIVLDNVPAGDLPFVHSVRGDSPLRGGVNVGDFLLSVDEVDCHGMSAVEASQVITARMHRERRLVLLRRRSSGDVEMGGGFESDPRYASF